MKKATLLSVLMVLMMAPLAMADTVTLVGGSGYGPYQTGSGGEFTFKPSVGLQWVLNEGYVAGVTKNVLGNTNTFQTFCIEGNETISSYGTYDAIITDRAIMGSQPLNGDPISKGTAWLYHEFQITGNFDGKATYNYTGTVADRKASAALLQKAIWWLEGEEGIGYDGTNPFMAAVVSEFGSQAGAKADNNGLYPVAALNLYAQDHGGDTNYLRQDQLVCVPEPATMLFLGGGLLGMAGFLRKKFKK